MNDQESFLKVFEPIFIYTILLLILITIIFNIKTVLRIVKKTFSRRELIIFFLSLFALTTFVSQYSPKTQRILYDEDIYMNAAQNIIAFNRNQYCVDGEFNFEKYACYESILNKQPPGYPVILSIYFRVFEISRLSASFFNNAILSLTLAVIFLALFLACRDFKISILGMLAFSLIPITGKWFNTASAEPLTSFFVSSTLLCFLAFYKKPSLWIFEVGMMFFLLTVYTRFEMAVMLIAIIYLVIVSLIKSGKSAKKQLSGILLICISAFIFSIPIILHFSLVKDDPWGAVNQSRFSFDYFSKHLSTNLAFFSENKDFPIVLTLLIAGILVSKRSHIINYFLIAALSIFSVYLFFYAGSYKYGADIRYALNSLSAFIILLMLGAKVLKDRLKVNFILFFTVALLINSFMLLPQIRERGEEGWQAWWDIEFISEDIKNYVAPDDYIFTNTPYVYHLERMNGRSLDLMGNPELVESLMENNKNRKFYFHFGFWCSLQPEPGNVASYCKNTVLDRYELLPVIEKERRDTKFVLYEIKGVKKDLGV